MSTFIDAELAGLADEVLRRGNRSPYPFAITLERRPLGVYIWKVWMEHNGSDCTAEATEPSVAIAEALNGIRHAKG